MILESCLLEQTNFLPQSNVIPWLEVGKLSYQTRWDVVNCSPLISNQFLVMIISIIRVIRYSLGNHCDYVYQQ